MQIIVAGTGKLATELLSALKIEGFAPAISWAHKGTQPGKSIVVHAGSGRELQAISAYCEATRSPLIELATGSTIESMPVAFPVVLCPNTNILMLKFMSMLMQSGQLFRGYDIKLTESHQASKTSVPGTAVNMARSLGISRNDIQSVRDVGTQTADLQIPEADLARHAFHQILIQDGPCSVKLETRVYGEAPYVHGVAQIIMAVAPHELENRVYSVMEFISNGWL
ncbi:MAG TPA: dihydrodipicolinate reductase [Rhodoferax sp.]